MCTFEATDERANTCPCVLNANRNSDATKREMKKSGKVA